LKARPNGTVSDSREPRITPWTIAMRAVITVDQQRRLLRFEFEQRATVTDWKEAQAAFLRLSEETGIRRALVDVRRQMTAGPQL